MLQIRTDDDHGPNNITSIRFVRSYSHQSGRRSKCSSGAAKSTASKPSVYWDFENLSRGCRLVYGHAAESVFGSAWISDRTRSEAADFRSRVACAPEARAGRAAAWLRRIFWQARCNWEGLLPGFRQVPNLRCLFSNASTVYDRGTRISMSVAPSVTAVEYRSVGFCTEWSTLMDRRQHFEARIPPREAAERAAMPANPQRTSCAIRLTVSQAARCEAAAHR